MLKAAKQFMYRTYMAIYGKTHKTEKKILFSSFWGRQYSDNPRAVSEKMHELYPEYEIEWYFKENFKNDEIVPEYVKINKGGPLDFYRSASTSMCVVMNESFTPAYYKKKDQCFAQVWHGDRGFKKILYDSVGKHNGYVYNDDKLADFCTAGSDFMAGVFRTAFDYHGEVMNIGIPRNDKLIKYDHAERKAVRDKLGIMDSERLLLYAPTYRQNGTEKKSMVVDLDGTMKHLAGKGEKWICAVRAHIGAVGVSPEKYMDLTDYPDMADLLLAADMLITDYSSCAGDFILTDKPVILVHFDRDEYLKSSRKFYFDPDESGYIIARDQSELEQIIDTYSSEDYLNSNKKVRDFYGVTETGRAAEIICKRINEICISKQRCSDE